MYKFSFLICLFILSNCSPKVSNSETSALISPQVFAAKVYKKFSVNRNASGKFAIIKNNSISDKTTSSFEFQVYDINLEKSIYKDYVTMGTVNWKDNEHIVVKWTPGEIEDENYTTTYILNIKTMKKESK